MAHTFTSAIAIAIRVLEKADNRFIGLEQRDEDQITALRAGHAEIAGDTGDGYRRNLGGAVVTISPLARNVTELTRNYPAVRPFARRQIPDELWRRCGVGLEQRRSSFCSGLDHPMHNCRDISSTMAAG